MWNDKLNQTRQQEAFCSDKNLNGGGGRRDINGPWGSKNLCLEPRSHPTCPPLRVVYVLHCTHSISECAPAITNIHLIVCSDMQVLLVLQSFPCKRQVTVGKEHLLLAHSIQAQAARSCQLRKALSLLHLSITPETWDVSKELSYFVNYHWPTLMPSTISKLHVPTHPIFTKTPRGRHDNYPQFTDEKIEDISLRKSRNILCEVRMKNVSFYNIPQEDTQNRNKHKSEKKKISLIQKE